ncbi:Modifier of rudimentary, Modr [Cynara cardunculus var. scolymus]|uniref:Modifier of rudimentary, Modr n=1 Tax=Cynara cardunculus var. scolymus TaxID=59895 RepID=A0A103XGU4_CYNCS|nr:Modifier of rudimentary, Modr [Cynara cardunculus var. scolymus]
MFKPFWGSEEQVHAQAYGDRPVSRIPPGEAAGIVVVLKDKSASELQKLLSNKDAYQQFLLSLDMVQTQIRLRDELRDETMQLAKHNLEKEPHIRELRNQCQIIRATELAAAREKLHELEKQKQEILRFYSPASLLHRLQEESEALHQQLLDREIDLTAFVQKYKRLRNSYHKRALTRLATNMSLAG